MARMNSKQVVVVAGPSGSGKDSVIRGLIEKCPNATRMVTATTRARREGETDGVDYHFMTNERFREELARGNILEYYHRPETDTYYGTYKADIEARIAAGNIVLCQLQIVGAKYFKEHYGATTLFIMPPASDAFEKRIRARAPMNDVDWNERLEFTKREIAEEAPWYDYRIVNEDGKLDEAVEHVIAILKKEGYDLGI
jgi:guanylate kinase